MYPITVDRELHLRLLLPEHASALFVLTNSNRAYLRQWLPWLDKVRVVSDTERFIDKSTLVYQESKAFVAGIWWNHRLVGVVGHNRIDWDNGITHPGYWLSQDCQNRGIMTRCVAALLRHAFNELELNRVEICAAVGNDRSQAIPSRLGFIREGIRREGERLYDRYVDLVVYGLVKSAWRLRSALTR